MMLSLIAGWLIAAALSPQASEKQAATPDQSAVLAVTSVAADRSSFIPQKGEKITWRYRVSAPSHVTAVVYDARNLLVRKIAAPEAHGARDQEISWDGRDDEDRIVPAGYYLVTMEAERDGVTVRWDPTDSTGGALIPPTNVGANPDAHEVHYALVRPALVRVLLGIKNGPILRTLLDWVARTPGLHAEAWDGWDGSHVEQFDRSPQLEISVWAYELPVNAVVIPPIEQGSTAPSRPEYPAFGAGRAMRPREPRHDFELYNHWTHERARCHDPKIDLSVAPTVARDDKGVPLITEPVAIRLETAPEEASFIQNERFELVVYIDGNFVTEEEQGYLPLSWTLGGQTLTQGDHVVTFMVRGYDGHFGTASIRVRRPEGPNVQSGERGR